MSSVVERSPRPLKRERDEFDNGQIDLVSPSPEPESHQPGGESHNPQFADPLPSHPIQDSSHLTPARSTTGSLTDFTTTPGSLPDHQSPMPTSTSMPSAFAALNGHGNAQPPPKKVKLTFQEREDRKKIKELKDRERAEEKARKDAEKEAERANKEAERAAKEAEKEAERVKKEAEKAAKEAEKKAKDEEKAKRDAEKAKKDAEKEERRKKKEEEKKKAEEAKAKKERAQPSLMNFFGAPAASKQPRASSADARKASASPAPSSIPVGDAQAASTPSKPHSIDSEYEKRWPSFFIKDNVTVAPINRFERDEEASAFIQNEIDSYITGKSPRRRTFDAAALFHLSPRQLMPRGRQIISVRQIMAEMEQGHTSKPIDLTGGSFSQNTQTKNARELLRKVPLKILNFAEDVRPPYRGTYTNQPLSGMRKLARKPLSRDLPDTNYDYDSEAEWVEDDVGDGEDIKSDGEEDEDQDDDEDMDGFLDDENDDLVRRHLVPSGDLEPISTGLCWEDRKKRNTNVKLVLYRMENILDPSIKSIDPFSTAYWTSPARTTTTMEPPRLPLNAMKNTSSIVNGPLTSTSVAKPLKSFFAPTVAPHSISTVQVVIPVSHDHNQATSRKDQNSKPKKLISEQEMPAFRAAIQGSDLSRLGLVEVLKKRFPGNSKASIVASLDKVAKRVGVKEVDKRWVLNVDDDEL